MNADTTDDPDILQLPNGWWVRRYCHSQGTYACDRYVALRAAHPLLGEAHDFLAGGFTNKLEAIAAVGRYLRGDS